MPVEVYPLRSYMLQRKTDRRVSNLSTFSQKIQITQRVLLTLKKRFRNRIASVILFGSLARDDHNPRSDIDLLVVFKSDVSDRLVTLVDYLLNDLTDEQKVTVHVADVKTLFACLLKSQPFVLNMMRGKVLYDDWLARPLIKMIKGNFFEQNDRTANYLLVRARDEMSASKYYLFESIDALYWALTDAAYAFLMKKEVKPTQPTELLGLLEKFHVNRSSIKILMKIMRLRKLMKKEEAIPNLSIEELFTEVKNALAWFIRMC